MATDTFALPTGSVIPDIDSAIWENFSTQQNFAPQDNVSAPAWNTAVQGNDIESQKVMSCMVTFPPKQKRRSGRWCMLTLPRGEGQETSMRFIDKGVLLDAYDEEPETRRNDTMTAPVASQQTTQDMGLSGGEAMATRQATDVNVMDDSTLEKLMNDPDVMRSWNEFITGCYPKPDVPSTRASSSANSRISTSRTTLSPVMEVLPMISDQGYCMTEENIIREEDCPDSSADEEPRKARCPRSKATKSPRIDRKKNMRLEEKRISQ